MDSMYTIWLFVPYICHIEDVLVCTTMHRICNVTSFVFVLWFCCLTPVPIEILVHCKAYENIIFGTILPPGNLVAEWIVVQANNLFLHLPCMCVQVCGLKFIYFQTCLGRRSFWGKMSKLSKAITLVKQV